jgi:hypothetical protein
MRRFLGPALLGVGVFLVVFGGLLKFYVADRVILTPIDQYAQTTSPGPVRSSTRPRCRCAPPTSSRSARCAATSPPATEDTAVWDVSVVLSTGDQQLVQASVDRVATDRRTAEAVNCCGEAVNSVPTRHSGLSYKFPFDTQKQTYQFWDANVKKAVPARVRLRGDGAGPDDIQVRLAGRRHPDPDPGGARVAGGGERAERAGAGLLHRHPHGPGSSRRPA